MLLGCPWNFWCSFTIHRARWHFYIAPLTSLLPPCPTLSHCLWSSVMDLCRILWVVRVLCILYVVRLARYSLGLQTLGLTIQRSMTDFGLLLLFVRVAVTLFSPLIRGSWLQMLPNPPHLSFSSIPASYWWSIISVTTVGYGDMVPHSIPGQLVALISILCRILVLSFPSTSIFHTFHCTKLTTEVEEHKRNLAYTLI